MAGPGARVEAPALSINGGRDRGLTAAGIEVEVEASTPSIFIFFHSRRDEDRGVTLAFPHSRRSGRQDMTLALPHVDLRRRLCESLTLDSFDKGREVSSHLQIAVTQNVHAIKKQSGKTQN